MAPTSSLCRTSSSPATTTPRRSIGANSCSSQASTGSHLIGVVPAAGYASRLQPLSGSKELVQVGGRPVIEYLLQRMQAAEPDEIRLVTRPEKVDLVRYARRRRMRVIEEHPRTLSASILSGTRDLAGDDVILLGFPDSIWDPVTGFIRLLEVVHAGVDAALGLFRMSEPERSDVVETTPDGRVRAIHVRPEKPRTNRVWGCAALRARVLDALSEDVPVGTLLGDVAGTGGVRGVDLSDLYLDIGTRTGLEEARRRLEEHSSSGLGGRPSSHSTLLP